MFQRQGKTYPYLDNYRGMLISLMILANFVVYFTGIPDWLNHADPFRGVYFIDFGAPLFLFIIGISYGISIKIRLERSGFIKTCGHFLLRYGLLWVFGLLGVWVVASDLVFGWNVLMTIGLSGLFALPFMFLRPVWRLAVGVIFLAVYQFVILPARIEQVLAADMGGYLGAMSWTGLVLVSSFWQKSIEGAERKRRLFYYFAVATLSLGLGLILNQFHPASKHLSSLPYMLYSYSLAVFVLFLFEGQEKFPRLPLGYFNIMGKNALMMYILSGLLILLFQSFLKPDLSLPLVVVFAVMNYALCLAIAHLLHKKALVIKL
jgi:predicted acyltransferase